MNPTVRTALAVICVGVITLCAVLIFGRVVGRARVADLTENKLYTLSAGTKRVLAKLNQPINLKLYYSRVAARKGPEQIRYWNNYYLYVRDLLEEYVGRSNGKLRLEVIDPRPFSEQEEQAIRYGVKRFQLSEDESFFFGLVATTELGKDKVIEFFEPGRQEFVEYDLSKIIASLMEREKRKIGVIASVPILGTDMSPYMMQMLQMQGRQPERPWAIVEQLRESYDVEKVELKEPEIPKDIDFLMVVHPKDLDKKTLFAIDQYVMKGGKLMAFVDPHCLADRPQMRNPNMMASQRTSSDLNALLEKWGVKDDPDRIAVDRTLGITTQLAPNRPPSRFPAYMALNEKCVSRSQVITASLHNLRVLFPGALTRVDGTGTDVQPLLTTTSVGALWKPSNPFELQFPDPEAINNTVLDGTEPLMLACVISGKFQSNFPNGFEMDSEAKTDEEKKDDEHKDDAKTDDAKKEDAKKDEAKNGPAKDGAAPKAESKKGEPKKGDEKSAVKAGETKGPATKDAEKKEPEKKRVLAAATKSAEGATVIVVADVDWITDMLAYDRTFFGPAQMGDNASLLLNMLDYLSGSDDLIKVRTRGQYSRPFKVVEAIEQEADRATAAEVKAINEKIRNYEKQLRELGESATEENVKVLQSEALAKRRTIEAEIRAGNRELRRLQAKRRESVEALAANLQTWNMVAAPSIILVIAITLAAVRWARAKRYAARRA